MSFIHLPNYPKICRKGSRPHEKFVFVLDAIFRSVLLVLEYRKISLIFLVFSLLYRIRISSKKYKFHLNCPKYTPKKCQKRVATLLFSSHICEGDEIGWLTNNKTWMVGRILYEEYLNARIKQREIWSGNLISFNSLMTSVSRYVQTSQFIYIANQLTGFYMMGNIDR